MPTKTKNINNKTIFWNLYFISFTVIFSFPRFLLSSAHRKIFSERHLILLTVTLSSIVLYT